MTSRGLPQGAPAELTERWRAKMQEESQRLTTLAAPPAVATWEARARYAAAYNSTAIAPSSEHDGVELSNGDRAFAEVRSLTASVANVSAVVTLRASQQGARATVAVPGSVTISGGSVRWWVMDAATKEWSLSPVEDTLATGVQRASTPDQVLTLGAR